MKNQKKLIGAVLILAVFLNGCGSNAEEASEIRLGSSVEETIVTESQIITTPTPEIISYIPDRYGNGYDINFLSDNVYSDDGIIPNKEINFTLNQMLYHIQYTLGNAPVDIEFLDPIFLESDSYDEGEPDDMINMSVSRNYFYSCELPLSDESAMNLEISLYTLVDGENEYFSPSFINCIDIYYDDYIYNIYNQNTMFVYDDNYNTLGTLDLATGMYTESVYEDSFDSNEDMGPSISSALQSDINLLEGYGFNPYEKDGVWYCNIGSGTIHYSTSAWVAAHSQLHFEPHWEGWISCFKYNRYIHAIFYSTDLVHFEDYSGNSLTLGRNGMQ